MKSAVPKPEGKNWLQSYLLESVLRDLCTQIHCTTCGAREFREGLKTEAARSLGLQAKTTLDHKISMAIGQELSQVRTPTQDISKFDEAVRLILFDLWTAHGDRLINQEIGPMLAGTWAGNVLARMKAHYSTRLEEKRAFAERNDPDLVRQRREQKRRAQQQKRAERIEKKKERDRLWWEKHEKASS